MTADPAWFLERYRSALQEEAGSRLALDDDDVEAVLALARDVAHGSERRNAPLATFLAGQFVTAGGSLREALVIARQLLPD